MHVDDLVEQARRSTSLEDFGDTPFREGLSTLLHACAEEADLSLFGQLGTSWDIGRLLSNLLRLHDEERSAPEILECPRTTDFYHRPTPFRDDVSPSIAGC